MKISVVVVVLSLLVVCWAGSTITTDVVIIGGGIGGLSAGAILSSTYGLKVHLAESHYRLGGCAHSFPITGKMSGTEYTFDAGPTIIAGASTKPSNPLQQVISQVGAASQIEWLPYQKWGMRDEHGAWDFELGENVFDGRGGPLERFGGKNALQEFASLRAACEPLCAGASEIPTMALRDGRFELLPLLPHFSALRKVAPYTSTLDGNFGGMMRKHVRDPWLTSWLNALAFSLSGLPAGETSAAAMAYTLFDLHRKGSALDYPKGGMGRIADVLAGVIKSSGSVVQSSSLVKDIIVERGSAVGVGLRDGTSIRSKKGVICNANIWALPGLLKHAKHELSSEMLEFLKESSTRKKTKSFLHLHLGLDASGLHLSKMNAHFTVMDKGLHCADPCADRNMVAVSNPCVLDDSLTNRENRIIIHAYGAGNEPYEPWTRLSRDEYRAKKQNDASFLWRSVSRALDVDEDELRRRTEVEMIGTPLTHERFLRRSQGTYGPTFRDAVAGTLTPLPGLLLAGDSTFPGIGVPAVAVAGAKAANTIVSPITQLLMRLR